jgi:hypothetical protein
MIEIRLTIFTVIMVTTIYLFSSLISRKFKRFQVKKALLYISAVAMIGVVGEITVDTFYAHFFHTPLWRYNFLPVHHAYTSEFAPFLWGSFGFYLYLTHHHLEKWTRRQLINLAFIFAFEALVIEATADLLSRVVLGNYIFYYYPNGLFHISAFQNFPFYLICGFIIAETIHRFKADPHFFTFISAWVTIVTVYLS